MIRCWSMSCESQLRGLSSRSVAGAALARCESSSWGKEIALQLSAPQEVFKSSRSMNGEPYLPVVADTSETDLMR